MDRLEAMDTCSRHTPGSERIRTMDNISRPARVSRDEAYEHSPPLTWFDLAAPRDLPI